MCLHYWNKCSVRESYRLLVPVLNAAAEIAAEAGTTVLRLDAGARTNCFFLQSVPLGQGQPEQGARREEVTGRRRQEAASCSQGPPV